MNFCSYCELAPYHGFCKCSITHDICLCARRCASQMCWIPLESMSYCKIKTRGEKMKNWLFVKNNKIYVKLSNDMVVIVDNVFGDNIPDTIDVIEYKGNFYIKGYEPKEVVKKSNKKGWDKDEE